MRKPFLMILMLVWFCGSAYADSGDFGFSFGYGVGKKDIDVYRFSVKKEYPAKWFESGVGFLSGYFELAYNRWEYHSDEINGLSFSPVFAYYFGKKEDFIRPYISGGIGVALIDEEHIRNKNLGSSFVFEDRIGIGARIKGFDMNISYFHYSNAGLESPNDGMDIWMITAAFHF